MRGARSVRSEQGSGALLLVGVLLPIIFMAMSLTVELSSFLSERRRLQLEVDDVARRMLRGGISQSEGEVLLRSRLAERAAFVSVSSLKSNKSSKSIQISVRAKYRPTFTKLIPGASTAALDGIPFTLSSVVSRVPFDLTLIMDRSVRAGESECGAGALTDVKRFTTKLSTVFSEFGASSVSLAVLDPVSGEVTSLVNGASSVPFPRCTPSMLEDSPLDILENIAASAAIPLDSFIAPVSIQEAVFAPRSTGRFAKKQVVVLVTTGFDDRWRSLAELPQVIQAGVSSSGLDISLVDVIVGASGRGCDPGWSNQSGASFKSRCIPLSSSGGLNGTLLTALVSEAGGAVLEK